MFLLSPSDQSHVPRKKVLVDRCNLNLNVSKTKEINEIKLSEIKYFELNLIEFSSHINKELCWIVLTSVVSDFLYLIVRR